MSFSPKTRELNAELKKFLFNHLYRHWRVERMAEKARRAITKLFKAYTEHPAIIPSDFTASYPTGESIERIVCDYIAGMTDRFALEEYAKLFDPHAKG